MDRTNISILLATALLGVLLYVVRQFGNAGLESVTPAARQIAPPATAADSTRVVAMPQTTTAELPIIDGPASLAAFLDALGLDGEASVAAARQWYEARGFVGANPLFGVDPDTTLRDYYASLDDATLSVMSQNNDVGATHELAARMRLTDPFGALELLQRAAEQGSVNALLQIASLQETLADVRPEDFAPDRDYARKLARVGGPDPASNLRYQAYVSVLTALRDGGEAVVDNALLAWMSELGKGLPELRGAQACSDAVSEFIALTSARRAAGLAPMNIEPPPVFLSVNDAAAVLPCRNTLNPIVSNLDLGDCAGTEVLDGRGALRMLYVCVNK